MKTSGTEQGTQWQAPVHLGMDGLMRELGKLADYMKKNKTGSLSIPSYRDEFQAD